MKTFKRKLKDEKTKAEKAWWHLSNQLFNCQTDTKQAIAALKKELKFHQVEASVIETKKGSRF